MYSVINTFSKCPGVLGKIESKHRTLDAAKKAVRKIEGKLNKNSYLPLIIAEGAYTRARYAHEGDWQSCEPVDYSD